MAFREYHGGCLCLSDANLVACLTTENGVIKGHTVDWRERLPAIEWGFSYTKLVRRRKQKKVPKGDPRRGRFLYGAADPRREETEWKPIVMFALRPFRGTFALHDQKLALWYAGKIVMSPDYAVRHRELMDEVGHLLDVYRKELRRREAEVEKKHGEYEIVDTQPPEKAEEVEGVSIPREDHPES